ncbi:MAG TPA: alpha-2-macroglobulin [Candidatus Bacteroides merdipullorum]|uniref:Alpha-2-macroglobulin n=1 Tax=Candidatus Bacteroides merdipullorum TaxID=2838474 RepID=A0A9D2A720_9BACE|nr:alpha-2-macroglobulin [Candidatus Bacteroides merdipullorum]
MKIIKCLCSFVLLCVLGAGSALHAQSYDRLWTQVEQAQEKSLPQTVIELTDRIYRKGLEEHNAAQMLKAYVCRTAYQEDLTPDSLYARLPRMEQWAQLESDAVTRAILYSLLADEYAAFARRNRSELLSRTEVDSDDLSGDIRLWTSGQFIRKVDDCCTEALRDSSALLDASAEDYVPFIELEDGSRFYAHDLYHLLSTRAIEVYQALTSYDEALVQERIERIYTNQINAYKQRPDREDALVLSILSFWQNDHSRFRYRPSSERSGAAYLAALDSLIEHYGDRPVCAEVYLAKAEWLNSQSPRRAAQALQVCEEGIRRYASYKRINELHNLKKRITQPNLSVSTKSVAYPGDSLAVTVFYCNQKGFTLNLYRTDLRENLLASVGIDRKFLQQHARRVQSRHFDLALLPQKDVLPEDLPYVGLDTVFSLPMPDDYGLYVLQVVPDDKRGQSDYHFVALSRLMALRLALPDNRLEVLTLDAKTGHPVPDVELDFYSSYYNIEADKKVSEATTGADGRAILTWDKKMNSFRVRKGGDVFLPVQPVTYGVARSTAKKAEEHLSLLTDRSLYRPGQTIYVKGIAYEQDDEAARVLEGRTYTISLLDVNRKEVSKQEVRTNDFGSFSAEFVLPTSCLNGDFLLKAGDLAMQSIRVEEYKRPTFSIAFDPVKIAYALGDTVVLTGRVEAYNGAAIQTVPLAYTVTRQDAWGRAYGWQKPAPLESDTITLDAEGRFALPVCLKADPEDEGRSLTYIVTASVTGENGETQAETCRLSATSRLFQFGSWLVGNLCKEDTLAATFHVWNNDLQLLDIQGAYRLYRKSAADTSVRTLVKEGTFTSGKRLVLDDWKQLPSGAYRLELSAKAPDGREESNAETGGEEFLLFSKHDTRLPVFQPCFVYEEQMEFDATQPAVFYYGTSCRDAYVLVDVYGEAGRIEHNVLQLNDTLTRLEYPYKASYGKGVDVRFSFVKDGKLYTQQVSLRKREPSRQLDMKWEVFRDHLLPGQQEEWKLVVKTPQGLPAAAEVLATMYDASLDQIFERSQSLSVYFNSYIPYYTWHTQYVGNLSSVVYFPTNYLKVPYWQYDHFYEAYPSMYSVEQVTLSIADVKSTKALGVDLSATARQSVTGAVNAAAAPQAKMYADGASLSEEVVVRSESLEAPQESGTLEPLEGLRTNFAETAFFYPQLRTNEQGELVFSFTAPESLTRWNFRGYSHTKDMLTGLLESTATTSKEFMLTPNLPRFVRVGDETHVAATINNLTQGPVKGTATLVLFDPLTDKVLAKKKERFSAEEGRSTAVDFSFEVTERYDLLGVRIVADGGSFSDGEQHVLPVLSNKTFVTESLPMTVRGKETRTFSLDSLFNRDSKTATDRRLTVEFTGNPAWMAVQALPALSEPTAEDAIARATAWYANSLAAYLAASQPRIQTVFEAWKAQGGTKETLVSRLEQNPDLKNILLSETPWLAEARDESEQMARIATLFDLNTLSLRLSSSLHKLQELQDGDGAWSWYPGMPGSRYVTDYILTLLVRLPLLTGQALDADAVAMRDKAFGFLHREVRQDYQDWLASRPRVEVEHLSDFTLDYLYLLALSGAEVPVANREAYRYYLSKVQNELTGGTVRRKSQALVILNKAGRAQAADFAASLLEHLVREDEMGAHFAFLDAPYRWGMMPVPSHVSAMEALRLQGGSDEVLEEMKLWLLQQKKTTTWDSPVAAADAVYALLCTGSNWLENRGDVRISVGRETMETLAGEASVPGLSYVRKTYAGESPVVEAKTVTVEKRDAGVAWGAVYAQYLSPMSELKQQGGDLSVDKQLYLERVAADGSKSLVPLSGEVSLSEGDIVVSRLTLRVERAMDFVQLKDERAACLEPVNALSGYRMGRVPCYEEVEDAATCFFFDSLGKGVYVLEHRQRVARSGVYEAGIATLQCAYAPEYASHSAGVKLRVGEGK